MTHCFVDLPSLRLGGTAMQNCSEAFRHISIEVTAMEVAKGSGNNTVIL